MNFYSCLHDSGSSFHQKRWRSRFINLPKRDCPHHRLVGHSCWLTFRLALSFAQVILSP